MPMKVMFDSGATTSLINKATLIRTRHLPINLNKQNYMMADGHTQLEISGTVRIFIQLNNINTNIIAGIVDSLCTNCILGMDYINKYKITLNNNLKQVQINTQTQQITVPMVHYSTPTKKTLCRSAQFVYLNPYQERQIKLFSPISSGQLLFSPTYRITKIQGLFILHSLISVQNHTSWITIYNPTPHPCYLNRNSILGTTTLLNSDLNISTIFDLNTTTDYDKDDTHSLNNNTKISIQSLTTHIEESQQKTDLLTMLKKHHPLFDITTTTIAETSIPHVICTGDNPPTTSKPYPQTREKQNATFDIIQRMLKCKQIRPSSSQYSAPILLIKKRDGSYRFIVDYRKLNNITIPDNYPLPNLEQAIQMVGGHKYYSKLDLRSGYFQIPIREEDRHKTAFITVHGLFEFNVLAQGLKNSPPSFQRIMSTTLLPCKKFCLAYLDDILIYSDSFIQHLDHLNQVLAILNKHKFQLNSQKCELARMTIDYLGHTLSEHGIKPLPERIDKILAIPHPLTLNQANAFIGAIGWYRKFIRNFSKIAAPILAVTNLTKNNKHKFKWDIPQQQAFDQLKIAITSDPLFLTYPDPVAPLILSTDASDYCIGGVLYQEINGERKNIYFHSQMLPQTQRKWPTIEKEALAIYYCVTRMKLYLLGHEFIIQTDHCPLRDMHKKPSNNRRVDRMSLVLQQYNIKEIRHVSGKCNCMADYLTRYPRQLEDDEEFFESDFGNISTMNNQDDKNEINDDVPNSLIGICAVTTRAQAKAQARIQNQPPHPTANNTSIIPLSSDDSPPDVVGHDFDISLLVKAQNEDKLCREKILELKNNTNHCSYTLENDILYKIINRGVFKTKLIVIPTSMISSLLEAYHDMPWSAHFGFRRTYFKLKDKYWWPEMKTSIQNYIQNCLKCKKFNVERKKPAGLLQPIETPAGPFQFIGLDYSGPFSPTPNGNRYVLAITDYFTKWVIAIPLADQTATTTAEAIYEHYITIYGVPAVILSDQGSHFNNQLMNAFTQILGFHHIKSTPYHPQTNGAIERFNSTFERQLAKLTNRQINDWDLHLKSITFAYNTGYHVGTQFSPYELQFGQKPKLPPDQPLTNFRFPKPNDYFHYLQKTLQIYYQSARTNVTNHKNTYKKYYDQNRPDIHYTIGKYVLKRHTTPPSKLNELYSDPMIVVKAQHPTYWIKNLQTEQIHQVHTSQLRSFNFNH